MAEKIIRDPVHDVIGFRLEKPGDALLFALINAEEFQRLRRIRQLGMASLAYPGADHSRYSHSLGVMETARRMLDQLGQGFTLDEDRRLVCVVGALLHDLGHGPFSHTFERVSGIVHETFTLRIIEDPDSDINRILRQHDAALPTRVTDLLRGEPERTFYSDIVSSQLDADRFDYLLRDNLMTGSGYGDFDLSWLLHALTIDQKTRRLAVTWKGISAVEAYLQSRYHMYRNVYFHKVVRTAEGMVKLALQRAKRLAVQDRLPWPKRGDAVYKALLGQRLTIPEFTSLDDISIQHCLRVWASVEDKVLSGLCAGLLYRRLFRTIDLSAIIDPAQEKRVLDAAEKSVVDAGGDVAYDMFYDQPADTPYEIYDGQSVAADILVCDPTGRLASFATISPLTQALSRQLMFRRLHVSPAYSAGVREAIARAGA
ncbi:MAG: HD domain-containing protein [Planctomycetota bacterium]|nr:HD domain-containing protein [Planctomycetota bacterium]